MRRRRKQSGGVKGGGKDKAYVKIEKKKKALQQEGMVGNTPEGRWAGTGTAWWKSGSAMGSGSGSLGTDTPGGAEGLGQGHSGAGAGSHRVGYAPQEHAHQRVGRPEHLHLLLHKMLLLGFGPPHWPVPCLPDGKAFALALPPRSPGEGRVTLCVLILQMRKLRLSKGSGQGFPAKTAWVQSPTLPRISSSPSTSHPTSEPWFPRL